MDGRRAVSVCHIPAVFITQRDGATHRAVKNVSEPREGGRVPARFKLFRDLGMLNCWRSASQKQK